MLNWNENLRPDVGGTPFARGYAEQKSGRRRRKWRLKKVVKYRLYLVG